MNGVLPWLVVATALVSFIRGKHGRQSLRIPALGALAALWIAAAISARITFPMTFRLLWVGPLIVGIVIGGAAVAGFKRSESSRWFAIGVSVVLASVCGAAVPIAQRGSLPDTRPANVEILYRQSGAGSQLPNGAVKLSAGVQVIPKEGIITQSSTHRMISVEPLLTFQSRSPDRCWTLFARGKARRGPARQFTGLEELGRRVKVSYRDDDLTTLEVEASDISRITHIESISRLPLPVWSHLNSFAQLAVTARGALSVSFSPCPDARIEIRASDYPFGRPARFAFLDAGDVFHVVEARSAEKGPFRELASGRLRKDAALAMTFFDDATPVFRVTLADWAAQAGRQISPTAGWRIPVNAIEFSLWAGSTAQVFITLAGTSVGRGYESVGHAAGVYRNRMSIESLAD